MQKNQLYNLTQSWKEAYSLFSITLGMLRHALDMTE